MAFNAKFFDGYLPLVKIYSFFGGFPGSIKENEFGKQGVVIHSVWKNVVKFSIWALILMAMISASFWYLIMQFPEDVTYLQYFKFLIFTSPSTMDAVTFLLPLLVSGFYSFCGFLPNCKTGLKLVNFMEFVNNRRLNAYDHYPRPCRSTNVVIIYGISLVVPLSTLGLILPRTLEFVSTFPTSEKSFTIPILLSTIVFDVSVYILTFPVMTFFILYISVIRFLVAWSKDLVVVGGQRYNPEEFKQNVNHFLKGLKKAEDLFSAQLFMTAGCFLICLISALYRALGFMMDAEPWNSNKILLVIAYIMLGLLCAAFFSLLAAPVTWLQENLDDLKEVVYDLDNQAIAVDQHAMAMIIHRLDSFDGFDASGYFKVDKSLLTSVLANFVTYFIILIQFKASGSPEE